MILKTRNDAEIAIKVCAGAQGDRFDLTACALACALHDDPNRQIGDALRTLAAITSSVKKRVPKTVQDFSELLFGEFGFSGTKDNYDDPLNCDFIHILTSRAGLPVGLGHIWRHAARVVEAPLFGTDTPGHFIMRLEGPSGPSFIDPFEGGAMMTFDDLEQIARRAGLDNMSERMLRPVSDRVMAVRLQTNLVARARQRGDTQAWVRAAKRRAILAPGNYQIAVDYSQAAEAAGELKTALEWSRLASQLPGAPASEQGNDGQTRTQALRYKLN